MAKQKIYIYMNTPTPTATPLKVSSSGVKFNLWGFVAMIVVTIAVTLIVNKVLKQTIVLKDNSGNVIGEGEVKAKLKGLKAA